MPNKRDILDKALELRKEATPGEWDWDANDTLFARLGDGTLRQVLYAEESGFASFEDAVFIAFAANHIVEIVERCQQAEEELRLSVDSRIARVEDLKARIANLNETIRARDTEIANLRREWDITEDECGDGGYENAD